MSERFPPRATMLSYFRSNIRSMSGYVPGEQPQGDGFVKLNTNENPYPPSPAVAVAVNEALQRGLQKYPDPLAGAFRRRAGELLGVPPEWILAGNGSDDILTIVTRALVGEGQLLRLPYPSYILYRTLAELQGARSEEIRFQPDWSLPEAFAQGSDDLRLVFLANPEQPLGHRRSARSRAGTGRTLALPFAGRRGLCRFRGNELPGPRGEEREDHGLADAEQVVRPGRAAVRLPGRPAALDRAVRQGEGFVQLRRLVDCRGHGGHRRPGLAAPDPREDSPLAWPVADGYAGFRVYRARFAS